MIDKVLKKPDQYVVKPQREGGGNNIYGADIPAFLKTIVGTPEQDAYIVMDMISPPVSTNYMIRPLIKDPMLVKTISELGIYGYCIGDDKGKPSSKECSGQSTQACSAWTIMESYFFRHFPQQAGWLLPKNETC